MEQSLANFCFIWVLRKESSINIFFPPRLSAKRISVIYFFRVQHFMECVTKEVSPKDYSPCHHQMPQILLSLPPLSLFGNGGGTGPPAGTASAAGAGPSCRWGSRCWQWLEPRQTSLGQKGSAFTLAAWMKSSILSSITVTSSWCRMRAEEIQAGSEREAMVRSNARRVLGKWPVSTAWHGASRWMKWGPHPNSVLASLEGPSTSLAAGERGQIF